MTIEKGKDWGHRGAFPADAPIVSTDRELASLFTPHPTDDGSFTLDGPSSVGLTAAPPAGTTQPHRAGANLAKTVSANATAQQLVEGERSHLPLDLAVATIDGTHRVLAASLVVRHRLWAGATDALMNASFLGEWNVAPRGHPNDGRLDLIRSELSLSDRWKARDRIPSGTHIPHPNITMRRAKSGQLTPDRGATIWLDGQHFGAATKIEYVVLADATTIII